MYFPEDEYEAPHRAKKDRKSYCGGHVGRKCNPVVGRVLPYPLSCGYVLYRVVNGAPMKHWQCNHGTVCSRCHKVIYYYKADYCPDYREYLNEQSANRSK